MKFSRKIAIIFARFRAKYRVSFRNPRNDKEMWYIYLSPLNLFTAAIAFLVILFVIVVTTVAYTPVMDLIPGYPGSRTRTELIHNNMRLDSLERQLTLWNNYYDNLVRIMDGKAPLMNNAGSTPDTLAHRADIPRIAEDSVLRRQMEEEGPYRLQSTSSGRGNAYAELYPPLKGVVTGKFDPQNGRLGTDVSTAENLPVMSIMEGTVISASWNPTEGSMIYILHPGNLISAYLHNARLTKKPGDRVYSGEVIAFTGSSINSQADIGYSQIQLWINGTPVDPENYIVF